MYIYIYGNIRFCECERYKAFIDYCGKSRILPKVSVGLRK